MDETPTNAFPGLVVFAFSGYTSCRLNQIICPDLLPGVDNS